MRIPINTRTIGGLIFGSALMLMFAGPAEISAAPKRIKSAIGNALAGQVGASAGTSAVRGAATTATTADPAAPISAAAAKPSTQTPQPPQGEAYQYNPEGRIDPFKPFVDLDAAAKKKSEKSKVLPQNPLQRLGIEQFRLVGIIEGDKGRRAMVLDASGKFYSLVPGSNIGLNNGRVTVINKDSVIIQERITTDEGKIESRRQVLKLRQDEVKP